MNQQHSDPNKNADLSRIIDDLLEDVENPVVLDKFSNLLQAASDLVAELQPEDDNRTARSSAVKGKGFLHTLQVILNSALNNPESLARHYAGFASSILEVLRQQSDIRPPDADRRFKDKLWSQSAFYQGLMQIYLAWSQHMQQWVEEQELDDEDRQRVNFIFEQFISALAPSNIPLNPGALRRVENSKGMSAVAGIKNWIQDVRLNQSMPRQINHNAYRLGEDLALTPGKVIYRNPQLELIQYSAQTARVHRRPLLLIPPQINKFYVFDLKPRNSLIKHLVAQGFQLYVISWKNPQRQDADWGLETYIRATLEAMEVIRAVSRFKTINLISACAGGFTAYALLGYLAATGNRMVHSHSLLVTALLPDSGSKLELFATTESLELARNISQRQGSMDGRDLAHLFAWLRPNDLVWKYWVNNYIMGRQPPPLDVLFWDNDPTRLPARLHHDFIDMYTGDVFQKANRQVLFGQPIDYRKLRVDTYFIAGEEDYLMPWRGIYRMLNHFKGKHRFVLCDSGHVQSILRPPSLANIHYYTNDDQPDDAALWLKTATHHEGSWWEDWSAWLHDHSASMKNAAKRCGNCDFPPLTEAPGEYVLEKMSQE